VKLTTRLRGFSDQDLIEGGEPAQARARDEFRRDQRLRVAMNSGKPEIARARLAPARFGSVEDVETGTLYRISAAEHDGANDTFDAFAVAKSGDPIFLERVDR
jgi:hypothetical protein